MGKSFGGAPVTLGGNPLLQLGDKAPNFTVVANDFSKVSLSDYDGKVKVISVVPSLDTGICSTQTRTFNQRLGKKENTVVLTISLDLPFAQARWCGASGLDHVITLSDHKDLDFANKYGLLMNEFRLLARAVIILNENNEVVYTEYLDEMAGHPNYDRAVEAASKL